MITRISLVLAGILTLAGIVSAQTTLPATTAAPATAPTTRKAVVAPAGFVIYEIGEFRVLAEPADEGWIRAALAVKEPPAPPATAPATQPATKPADVAGRLRERRDELARMLTADLALAERKTAAEFVDQKLLPRIQAVCDLQVPTVFMVTTQARLKAIMKAGWEDDRFYYNRTTDDVGFNPNFQLTTDRPMDDLLVPALYDPQQIAEERAVVLKNVITSARSSIKAEVINRSASDLNLGLVQFMVETAVDPLKFKADQRWLGQGIVAVLSAKYLADVIGVNRDELLSQMVAEPRGGMSIAGIDLLHPVDLTDLKKEAIPAYLDATRRKSAIVVHLWLKKSGDEAIPKVLTVIRQKMPANGPALTALIKDQTGFDIAPLLGR